MHYWHARRLADLVSGALGCSYLDRREDHKAFMVHIIHRLKLVVFVYSLAWDATVTPLGLGKLPSRDTVLSVAFRVLRDEDLVDYRAVFVVACANPASARTEWRMKERGWILWQPRKGADGGEVIMSFTAVLKYVTRRLNGEVKRCPRCGAARDIGGAKRPLCFYCGYRPRRENWHTDRGPPLWS